MLVLGLVFIFAFAKKVPIYSSKNHSFILQVSDIHFDLKYLAGSNPYCTEEQCCRNKDSGQTASAGMFGFPGGVCDIPMVTYINSLNFVRNLTRSYPPLALLVTGDYPDHFLSQQTQNSNLQGCVEGWNDIVTYFKGKGYPVLISIGNHDSYPDDNLAKQPGGNWLLEPFGNTMSNFVDTSTSSQAHLHGYFSYTVNDITFINLNTEWINSGNQYVKDYPTEKTHEMKDWIIKELTVAQSSGKKVVIMGHIPPQGQWYRIFKLWNTEFVSVVNQFKDIILFSTFAHEHDDRFFLTRDSANLPVSINFIQPPITTFVQKFPSARVFVYNNVDKSLVDVLTFYNNLNQSNEAKTMDPYWYFEYSMKEEYSMPDLSPKSFSALVDRFKTDDDLFDVYTTHFSSDYMKVSCRDTCKQQAICLMNYTDYEKFSNCNSGSMQIDMEHPLFSHWKYL